MRQKNYRQTALELDLALHRVSNLAEDLPLTFQQVEKPDQIKTRKKYSERILPLLHTWEIVEAGIKVVDENVARIVYRLDGSKELKSTYIRRPDKILWRTYSTHSIK